MSQTGHKYFKTRVTKGIDTKTMHEVYFPQASTQKGKWAYVTKDGVLLHFYSKADAHLAAAKMLARNDEMLSRSNSHD